MKRSCHVLLALALAGTIALQAQTPRATPYRILVTNDDGVRAPGLAALADALRSLGEVIVVAPSDGQSGKSHAVVTLDPVFREELVLPNGLRAIGLSTTPATTMFIALRNIVTPKPDLVVSGINPAYNVGYSAYRSGTVAAAREGAMQGVPAIAASMASTGASQNLASAAGQILAIVKRIKDSPLAANTFLNVNVPPPPVGGYKGLLVTSQAMTLGGSETFVEMRHPSGRPVYWSVYREGTTAPQGTDAWAVENGYVSVTPMRVGEYDAPAADRLRGLLK